MATTITTTLAALPDVLRDCFRRDDEAIRSAVARTFLIDAQRWIQWSIHGGDSASVNYSQPTQKIQKRKKSKKPKSELGDVVKQSPCDHKPPSGYRKPVDTGDYKNSWTTQILDDGAIFYSQPVYSPAKAGVIEEGRRPKFIPIAPLAQWVRRKFNCRDPVEAERIALAISRHAAHHPRPGLFVLKRAHPKIAAALQVNLTHALGRAVALVDVEQLFKNSNG